MGIWIRSQNKMMLVNTYQIFVASDGIVRVVDIGSEETTIVGKYSTKERAIEVLDEIHTRLNTHPECVYLMPAE